MANGSSVPTGHWTAALGRSRFLSKAEKRKYRECSGVLLQKVTDARPLWNPTKIRYCVYKSPELELTPIGAKALHPHTPFLSTDFNIIFWPVSKSGLNCCMRVMLNCRACCIPRSSHPWLFTLTALGEEAAELCNCCSLLFIRYTYSVSTLLWNGRQEVEYGCVVVGQSAPTHCGTVDLLTWRTLVYCWLPGTVIWWSCTAGCLRPPAHWTISWQLRMFCWCEMTPLQLQ
jgi:hypothetical protein